MKIRFLLIFLILLSSVALLVMTRTSEIAEDLLCNRLNLSLVEIATGQKGLEAYQRLLAGKEAPTCASFQLGLLAARGGEPDRSRQLWSNALRLSAEYLAPLRAHAPADAELADIATQHYPQSAAAWDWAGDAALQAVPSQPEVALEYLLKTAVLRPSDNLVWEKIGSLAGSLGQTDLAIRALRNACDLYPIRNGNCLSAARLSYDQADYENVIRYYTRGFYPEHPDGWARLISAARLLGKDSIAQRFLSQAQQEYPADYEELIRNLP